MNNIQKQIGDKITGCRKRLKMNQLDFAERLSKSLRTVQKYESGEIDMPVSVLAEIAGVLSVSINYLVGYDASHIKLESVSDVLAYVYELDRKKEVAFDVDIKRVGKDGKWQCSLIFDGQNNDAMYNADFCKAMETFSNNRDAVNAYWMDYETYDAWENSTLEYYSKLFIADKERETLDLTEIIARRNKLDKENLKESIQKTNSADNE